MINIPAIDIINSSCVRLTKGEFDRKSTYNRNPVDVAIKYEKAGATHIHIVDLDAARGIRSNEELIFEIAQNTNLTIQYGGGIKTKEMIDRFFSHGINAVIVGSLALRDRAIVKSWIKEYGSEKIIVGADVRNNNIAVDGWLSTSDESIIDFIFDYMTSGATHFLCTDIQLDGTLEGPSEALYRNLISKFPDIKLIASGGVSSIEDIRLLDKLGMHACVIGKALFENKIDINSLFR